MGRVALAGLSIGLLLCALTDGSSFAADSPPRPDLARYVPSTYQVTSERSIQLSSKGPPQVVVTDEGAEANSQGSPSRDLLILSWDHFAKRWVTIFDGAQTKSPNGPGSALSEDALLPTSANVFQLEYAPIFAAKGERDLEFWANYNFGANDFLEVGVIHYNGQVADLSYYTSGVPGQGTVRVIGRAPHQELRIPVAWLTDDDPQCCAIRTYVDTIGFRVKRLRGGYISRTYVVTASTQSWLGVYAAIPPSTGSGPPANPFVLNVAPGGPAAGILQPGDQLIGVAGASVPSSSDLGPPVIDEVAKSLPGAKIALTIERGGSQQVVDITLASTASPAFAASSAPTPGYLGADFATLTPQLSTEYGLPSIAGALVVSVGSDSPAATVGLVEGDVITSIGSTLVSSFQSLEGALYLTPPGTTVQVAYTDGSGTSQTTDVTLGSYPADTPGPLVTSI